MLVVVVSHDRSVPLLTGLPPHDWDVQTLAGVVSRDRVTHPFAVETLLVVSVPYLLVGTDCICVPE